jgi:signal transduction histidine kinase
MKIRKRITYTFTGLFGVLILLLCLLVYFISIATQKELFFNRLDERLKITEQFFLESDGLSAEVQEKVRDNFLKTLPQEVEYLDTLDNFYVSADLKLFLPPHFLAELSQKNSLKWSKNGRQGIARIYQVKGVDFIVLVMATDEHGNAYLGKLRIILLLSFLISVVVTFFLSNYFSRNVLKPIAGKIKKANIISASNLDMRLTVYNQTDELGMLAQSFNDLLDRLQTAFELEKNFVRYASHELKNPLAVILGEAEVTLLKPRSANEYIDTIEKIKGKAEKLNMLVEYFLQLSKLDSVQLNKQKVSLEETLMEVIFNLSQAYDHVKITFNIGENGESDDFEIDADEQLIYNAIYNLIDNACKFSKSGGQVIVNLEKSRLENKIFLLIKDEGIGIEQTHIEHVFKPLYRGENAKQIDGTGIGLALVKRILDLHEFEIKLQSEPNKGTEFVIFFS